MCSKSYQVFHTHHSNPHQGPPSVETPPCLAYTRSHTIPYQSQPVGPAVVCNIVVIFLKLRTINKTKRGTNGWCNTGCTVWTLCFQQPSSTASTLHNHVRASTKIWPLGVNEQSTLPGFVPHMAFLHPLAVGIQLILSLRLQVDTNALLPSAC